MSTHKHPPLRPYWEPDPWEEYERERIRSFRAGFTPWQLCQLSAYVRRAQENTSNVEHHPVKALRIRQRFLPTIERAERLVG